MKQKQIIIHLNDHCEEDFNHVDTFHMKEKFQDLLSEDYDVEITEIEVKNVETRPTKS